MVHSRTSCGATLPQIGRVLRRYRELQPARSRPRELFNTVKAQPTIHALTPRKVEALHWAAKGKAVWKTAEILYLSPRTVNEHVRSIARKLGVANKTHALAIAIQNHVIKF